MLLADARPHEPALGGEIMVGGTVYGIERNVHARNGAVLVSLDR